MVKIWVTPDFRNKLKKKAAEEQTSILNLSDRLAKSEDLFEKKKKDFFWRLI